MPMPTASAPFAYRDNIALVLQGGGALGAYQAGVYEELCREGYRPKWIAGVSIGAINAALIAGNAPERCIERLSEFWHLVSSGMGPLVNALSEPTFFWTGPYMEWSRRAFSQFSAFWAATLGIPGLYRPRIPPALLQPAGALSVYDPAPLRATLERLVDFDRINEKKVRLSLGAVNVRSGNSEYFDNFDRAIGPEHIMASAAMPPAFPPVEIDGESYWDGGILSNTPLQYVLDARPKDELLVFQVDLFSARGEMPANLAEVLQRQKDILYSSRSRYTSKKATEIANTRQSVRDLLLKLPAPLKDDAAVRRLIEDTRMAPTDIVHLVYRQASYELESKDYEFSRASMLAHWRTGQRDLRDAIEHPDRLKSSGLDDGVTQYHAAWHFGQPADSALTE